jgi:hypothetical protein
MMRSVFELSPDYVELEFHISLVHSMVWLLQGKMFFRLRKRVPASAFKRMKAYSQNKTRCENLRLDICMSGAAQLHFEQVNFVPSV